MPFAVTGGALIPGADVPGLLKAGDANKVVIKFSVQPQLVGVSICNTAIIRYYDMDNKLLSLVAAPKAGTDQLAENSCITSTSGARKANVDTAQIPAKSSVKVRPNPFSDNLYVQVTLSKNENVLIRLTDLQGRIVYTSRASLSTGVNNLNITLKNNLPRGIYIIEVLAGNKRLSQQKLEKL
jgi:methionine-rich copper-binding protein CopC